MAPLCKGSCRRMPTEGLSLRRAAEVVSPYIRLTAGCRGRQPLQSASLITDVILSRDGTRGKRAIYLCNGSEAKWRATKDL